jgi:hypothetical protein
MRKNVTIVDKDSGDDIGSQILQMLRQLFYKIPRTVTNVNDLLKVTVESGTIGSATTYPVFNVAALNEVMYVKGPHYSNIRWQQQRSLITDN